MQRKSDENLTRVYNALANPYTRRIIQILRENGRAGFKELHDSLRISVGALQNHLDTLEGLVTLGADKMYSLTDQGRTIIDALSVRDQSGISNSAENPVHESRFGFIFRELLFGRAFFNYLSQAPGRSFPFALTVLALGGYISFQTNLEPILLFYLKPTPGIGQVWFLLMFPLGWFITFGVSDLLCYVFFHKRGGEQILIGSSALSMLPLLLVPGLILFVQPISGIIQSATAMTILIQLVVQIWVICLLSRAISTAKGLRIEQTALVSLAVMYMNITAVILALQVGLF